MDGERKILILHECPVSGRFAPREACAGCTVEEPHENAGCGEDCEALRRVKALERTAGKSARVEEDPHIEGEEQDFEGCEVAPGGFLYRGPRFDRLDAGDDGKRARPAGRMDVL